MASDALLFRATCLALAGLFVWFGMDVRRKRGARPLAPSILQHLMKAAAFSLIGAFVGIVLAIDEPDTFDWLALGLMGSGTAFVVAARRALGAEHTFTGQYRDHTQLVTHGVYALSRNPLYFGVFLCELGAAACVARHLPSLFPEGYPYVSGLAGATLAYAVAFNWTMAGREARELERQLGDAYRRYRARVPFLIPFTK